MRKKVELLSPAGSYEAMLAAVNNGADAVYLGGKNFSARAFANNFSHEELEKTVRYCHERNVRVFVTVNTLLTDIELDAAMKEIEFLYSINVDALIIQDLGLYYRVSETYPDFELHASTQMHVHNLSGVRTVKKLGFKRVVLARESSLELIEECCKEDIEIEVFCHGAICTSFSGQCLLSSCVFHRSANRGMCAQPCRLKYQLLEDGIPVKTDTDYLISPKDMFLLEDIPDLLKAGVSSLKIEGRMKSPAYVGYVTRLYRKAIDAYYSGENYEVSKDELNHLKVLFNRGFTNSYLRNKEEIYGSKRPNHMGIPLGKVVAYKDNKLFIKLTDDVRQFDGIRILNGKEDDGMILNKIYLSEKLVNSAKSSETIGIDFKGYAKSGDIVLKTLDHEFEDEISKTPEKKIPISLSVHVNAEKNIEINESIYDFHYISDMVADTAQKKPLDQETIIRQLSKLSDSCYSLENIFVETKNAFLPVSKLNEVRRDFVAALSEFRYKNFCREVHSRLSYGDICNEPADERLLEKDDYLSDYRKLPVINTRSDYMNEDKIVVSEMGGLLRSGQKIAYYTLNCMNSYAYELLQRLGFKKIIVSSELSSENVSKLIEAYKMRNHSLIRPYVLVYGQRELMYFRYNPFVKYMKLNHKYSLVDRDYRYEIEVRDNYTVLLESECEKEVFDHSKINPFYIARSEDQEEEIKRL